MFWSFMVTLNIAAVNFGVYEFLNEHVFYFIQYMPGSGIAWSDLHLAPRGNAKLFPKAAAPFYIRANNIYEGFNFFPFCLFALY